MRKSILSAAVIAGAAMSISAASLTPEAALEAALKGSSISRTMSATASAYSLEWTGEDNGVYVFAREKGGFLIAAGDDNAPALLGFSDSATFDPETMPEALKAMLTQMDRAIASGRAVTDDTATPRADIAPLISSQWNQDSPYNLLCPEIDGEHTLTGCVATAEAQVLRYWKYPVTGTGEVSYRWNGGNTTLKYDFTAHTFDYDNMTDTYGDTSTDAQRQAVAELMLAAGMASEMEYSMTFSGSTDTYAALGLIKYLGYDAGVKLLYRDFYRIAEWNALVYAELEAKRPVLYYGFSPAGGHAFICDGYMNTSGDDYFHINWGWGGLSDGYFLLSVLNPEYLGLGGSTGGFNIMQSALFGLKPAGETPSELYRQVLWFGYFGIGTFEYTRGQRIMFGSAGGLMRGGLYNMSLEDVNVRVGIQVTPEAGGEPMYFEAESAYSIPSTGVLDRYNVASDTLPEGTFIVRPAFCYIGSDEWQAAPEEVRMHTRMVMTVSDDRITFDITDDSEGMILTYLEVNSPILVNGEPFKSAVEAYAYNTDEPVRITPVLTDSYGQIMAQTKSWDLKPVAGQTYSYSWDDVFEPQLRPGTYQFIIIDDRLTMLSEPVPVSVMDPGTETEFYISNFRINRKTPSSVTTISGNKISISYRIAISAGFFEGTVTPWVFDNDVNPLRALNDGEEVTLFPAEGKNVTYTCDLDDLDHDPLYSIGVRATSKSTGETETVSKLYKFKFSDSGIDSIEADADDCELYDASGLRIDSPAKGRVTIVRRPNGPAAKVVF